MHLRIPCLLLLALLTVPLQGQNDFVTTENPFSSVTTVTGAKSGRFWFATGRQFGYTRYTYHGSKVPESITSNVVFRIQRGNSIIWHCNANNPSGRTGGAPQTSQGDCRFTPYDEIYRSATGDTIEVRWNDMSGFKVVMRFVSEDPRHEYDDGADILLEWEYEPAEFVPPGSTFGIFLMLDVDNGMIFPPFGPPGSSDKQSILTDRKYFNSRDFGGFFQKAFGGIPEWYLAGYFEFFEPIDGRDEFRTKSVHRLTGTSLGGAPLDEPNEFAIGNWNDFKRLSWLINGDVDSKQIGDVATAMRWENLGTSGKIRTAFGTTSREGNNLYHCGDSSLFVVVRTERVVSQDRVNGPYAPAAFDIEMWLTNLDRGVDRTYEIGIDPAVRSWPNNDGRMTIGGGAAFREINLAPAQTKKLVWRALVNQNSRDTLAELRILFRDTIEDRIPREEFEDACRPKISFKGAFVPPPEDDRPPVIATIDDGRDVTRWWNLRTFDRHAGFAYDTGLDKIEMVENDGNNMRMILTPDPFRRCEVSETVRIRLEVIDTTRAARARVLVTDCNGNTASFERSYSPRPDPFTPEIDRIDTIRRYELPGYPCAVPEIGVFVRDDRNQSSGAGDLGFGRVELLDGTNIEPIAINYDRGNAPINDYDSRASFRILVSDTLEPASARVIFVDFAGNADTFEFTYCPLPDTSAPSITAIPGGPAQWSIEAADSLSWDRGLLEIVEIASTNMTALPWPPAITSGDRSFSGLNVSVVDDAWPASGTWEVRDTYYESGDPSTHAAHSARVTLSWDGIDDTLAPIISIDRDLSVPAPAVEYIVSIVDSHTVAGQFYRYDRGIESVSWGLTANMQVLAPLTYTDNRRGATFRVGVINPIAVNDGDTICVTAVDSAGNRAIEVCQEYPSTPDRLGPLFRGRVLPDRTLLTGVATDDRPSDRGLASIEIRMRENVGTLSRSSLEGMPDVDITASIDDPTEPYSGVIVVRDLFGIDARFDEVPPHTLTIPFSVPVVELALSAPELVDGGEEIRISIATDRPIDPTAISSISFGVDHRGAATLDRSEGTRGGVTLQQNPNRIDVRWETDGESTVIPEGTEIAALTFSTVLSDAHDMATIRFDETSFLVNDGLEDTIRVSHPGDSEESWLILPAPYAKGTGDTLTVINGDCIRTLGGERSGRAALTILQVQPNPLPVVGDVVTMHLSSGQTSGDYILPATVSVSLVDATGVVRTSWSIEPPESGRLGSYVLPIPTDLSSGAYWIGIDGEFVPLRIE